MVRQRAKYLRNAYREGISRLLAFLGVVSLVTGIALIALFDLSPWLVAVIVLAFALVALAEGAYSLHKRQGVELSDTQQKLRAAEQLSPSQSVAGIHIEGGSGNLAWGNTQIINQGPEPAVIEAQRRAGILAQLHQEWVLSNDGISPAMLAGTEPLPKGWVETRLAALGETWRQTEYRPGRAEIPRELGPGEG